MSLQQHPPHETLFRSTSIGGIDLTRIALAPMTRVSATADGVPTDRIGRYYKTFAVSPPLNMAPRSLGEQTDPSKRLIS